MARMDSNSNAGTEDCEQPEMTPDSVEGSKEGWWKEGWFPLIMLCCGFLVFASIIGLCIALTSESTSFPFVEGDSVECFGEEGTVYRFTNGQLRSYQDSESPFSWDPDLANVKKEDCTGVPREAAMPLLGEGDSVEALPSVGEGDFVEALPSVGEGVSVEVVDFVECSVDGVTADFCEEVPDISRDELAAVLSWIKAEVTMVKNPFCWKNSYGRGVGGVLHRCEPPKEQIGALCYSPCPAGMSRFGFDCHSNCPDEFRDDGLFCRKPEYGRGVGYPWEFGDWVFDDSGQFSRCESDYGKGNCELWGAIVYPKCKPGYYPFGCCICRPAVPQCGDYDLNDGIDLSCAKRIKIGDPSPLKCSTGEDEDAGLCYNQCEPDYYGVGPVCWQNCDNSQVNCGAACAISAWECGMGITEQVVAPLVLAANIASLGLATPATAAGTAGAGMTLNFGGKVFTGTTKLGRAFIKIVKTLQSVRIIKTVGGVGGILVKTTSVLKVIKHARTGSKLKTLKTSYQAVNQVNEGTEQASDLMDTSAKQAYMDLKEYRELFADEFAEQTSSAINAEIDRNFHPVTARFVKMAWAEIEMLELAEAETWNGVSTALGLVSIVDVTGVVAVVAAYAKPICKANVPFPQVSFRLG